MLRSSELGSISNLTEDETSFPIYESSSLRSKVLLNADNGGTPASTRSTRSRARSDDANLQTMKAPKFLSSEKLNGAEVSSILPTAQDAQASRIYTDVDNDELDLIGSSMFSRVEHERRRHGTREIEENSGSLMSVDVTSLASTKTSACSYAGTPKLVPHSVLLTDGANQVKVEREEHSMKRYESSKDKDDAMDDEEVETITKDAIDEEDSTTASALLMKELSDKSIAPTRVRGGGSPQEESLAAIPISSSQVDVGTHVNAQIMHTPVSVPNDEKLFQINGASQLDSRKRDFTIETDGNKHFDPIYTLPPLGVMPADFTRKAKPIRRKKDKEKEGKRDRDDTVPMGLARWSATLMANPLWRKVSRANKTLSTREWSVRSSQRCNCPR